MPEFAAPLWLAGLVVVPLIWWLHRLRQPQQAIPVSALFLWQGSPADPGAGPVPQHSDPRWLLRALLYTVLLLVLADPGLPGRQPLTVWFDVSASMQARENGTSRMSLAIAKLLTALRQRAAGDSITVRPLGNPAAALQLPAARPGQWRDLLADWAATVRQDTPRRPASLPAGEEHWVVTDGSDPELNAWLASSPASRVIRVGDNTANSGLVRLALRRSLESPQRLLGLLSMHNYGPAAVERRLEVLADGQPIHTTAVMLEAGQTRHHDFSLPATRGVLQARLTPADALPSDDRLLLARDAFQPVAVSAGDGCNDRLRDALAAHPGLALRDRGAADDSGGRALLLDCGGRASVHNAPVLVTHPGASYVPVGEAPHWHARAGRLRDLWLDAQWLAVNPSATADGRRLPLLSAGPTPLLLADDLPGRIDILIDLENPALARRPEYPVLLGGLAGLALGRDLLDPVVVARHDPRESAIRPTLAASAEAATRLPGKSHGRSDLAPHLIVVAMLLLLADLWLRPRRPGAGRPAG